MTMQPLADFLTEKYLLKMINEECKTIFEKHFESLFSAYSAEPDEKGKDTTLMATFRMMEGMANITITHLLEDMEKNTWIKKTDYSYPSLCEIADSLLDHFLDYVNVKPYIENYFDEEYCDKKKELFEKGIIDEEGDYIGEIN